MGSNNNKNTPQQPGQYPNYGPNPGQSGSDPRGRTQNQSQYQQQRYESQQGPVTNAMAGYYGQGAQQGMNDYGNIMSSYRNYISPSSSAAQPQMRTQGGGGFDPSSYNSKDPASVDAYIKYMQSQPGVNPSVINDPGYWRGKMLADTNAGGLGPDANYVNQKMMTPEGAGGGNFSPLQGFQQFANTGGYSPQDMANLRARGVSPIRAAYANAQREVGRQRSLQGGYSPNAIAAQVKMAREQGQGMADAAQNVEAGIVNQRNQNMLTGLQGGQAGILGALGGQAGMYGATPGMASTFGNQLLSGIGQGGQFGLGLLGHDIQGQTLPGQFDTTMGRIGAVGNVAGAVANPILDYYEQRRRQQQQTPGTWSTDVTPNTSE